LYGRCDLAAFENLFGAVNDVAAMRDLLTSPKFGFPTSNVVVISNPELPPTPNVLAIGPDGTTHDGILANMRKYLVEQPNPNDTVVFYYSGHGSLRVNSKGTKLLVSLNGNVTHADSTIVASDVWTGAYDIRDREMTRIFHAALDKGVKLTAIFDSCHSGGIARGIALSGAAGRKRWVPFDSRDIGEGPDLLPDGKERPAPAARADNPALVLSASQQDQTAKETPPPDTGDPQGLFTIALIKALKILPVNTPASVIYQRVKADLEGNAVTDQTPAIDAGPIRLGQPLFGGSTASDGKLRVAVVATNFSHEVILDTGKLAGIGPNSEFQSLVASDGGARIALTVTQLDGIARSKAVANPPDAHVNPGDVFELTKWVPPPMDPLSVWTWPANLTDVQVRAAMESIRSSGISPIQDPAVSLWTDMLSWDGTDWLLQHAGTTSNTRLGPALTADTLKRTLPAAARIWVNLPPPKELAAGLILRSPDLSVQEASDAAHAEYVLAGTLNTGGPQWTWYHKPEVARGPSDKTGYSPGCSASQYPERAEWVSVVDPSSASKAALTLNTYAARIAKLKNWLNLASSPTEADSEAYYTLGVKRLPGETLLAPNESVAIGDRLKLVLTSSQDVQTKRWMYVLDIDCQGNGRLVYPVNAAGNQFPNNANAGRQIDLAGVIDAGPPLGLDTLVLISLPQELPDPSILNFEGFRKDAAEAQLTPLQRLLSRASKGLRGMQTEIPTDWGISVHILRTRPK